ncbi:MAG: HPr kinase/phosphorylase [Planktomarina sp.]
MDHAYDIWKNWGPDADAFLLHATAVAWQGRAALLLGPSGSGKSDIALQMMAYGCDLIGDDRVLVTVQESSLVATTPAPVSGKIEARGLGILHAPFVQSATLQFAVDLSRDDDARFPAITKHDVLQIPLHVYVKCRTTGLAAALFHLLRYGSVDDVT